MIFNEWLMIDLIYAGLIRTCTWKTGHKMTPFMSPSKGIKNGS
jgi:hypothetical protein